MFWRGTERGHIPSRASFGLLFPPLSLVTGFLLPWRRFPTPSAAEQKKKKKKSIPSTVHCEVAAINGPWRAGDFHLGFSLKNK